MTVSLRTSDNLHVLTCDSPGCPEIIEGLGSTPSAQRRFATGAAEVLGWQLSSWENKAPDYCAKHVDVGRAEHGVTELYRDGQALPYARRA